VSLGLRHSWRGDWLSTKHNTPHLARSLTRVVLPEN